MGQDNKAIIRGFVEAWNNRDLDSVFTCWDPEVVHHARFADHRLPAIKQIYGSFMQAFPDLHFRIEDMVTEGDKVVTRMTASGTHRGEFLGRAPSGRPMTCGLIDIARLADGKIVEHWGITDELRLMADVGILPSEYLSAMS